MAAQAANADAIIGGDDLVCDERVLAAAKKRAMGRACMSAGVEECLGKKALETSGRRRDQHARRRGPGHGRAQHCADVSRWRAVCTSPWAARRGEGWNRNFAGSSPQSLNGKTMLVAGLGGIGLEVARRAHALGMKVIATRAQLEGRP